MVFSCFLWLLFSTFHCRHHRPVAVHSSLASTFFLWINPCNLESILTCKSISSPWLQPFQSTHNIQPKYHSPSHHCNLITMAAAHSINLLSHIFNSSAQLNRARARFICNQPPSITCNITSPSSVHHCRVSSTGAPVCPSRQSKLKTSSAVIPVTAGNLISRATTCASLKHHTQPP
ncbi:hypothetical protein M0R45_000509 [Rubus argutus]|uniref:Secreted protein n=1 Tax=Rubus argutus TaxID=59490 RepID=A0AAW1VSK9_RUBAR